MLNADELLFVVDENNQPLEPKTRQFVHANKLWHRTSDIWIVNKDRQVLCQKRSLAKDQNPGLWEAFFGGHMAPSQEYVQNAISELKEELGLKVKKIDLIFYKIFKSNKPTHKEFPAIFALILDSNRNDFQIEKEEIDQLIWKSIDELKEILVNERSTSWVQKPWDSEVLEWLDKLANEPPG